MKTYTFDELMSALNAVAPYDWAGFFHQRLNSISRDAPVGGIENGGMEGGVQRRTREVAGTPGQRPGDVYSIGLQLGE